MTSHRSRLLTGIVAAVLAVVITSCSIDPEGSPRDIAVRDRLDLSSATSASQPARPRAPVASTSSRPKSSANRAPFSQSPGMSATSPANAIRALFEGPNTDELQAMLRSAIPPGTRLLDVNLDGGELIVNVSSDLQQLTGESLIDGVAQIVLTASDITGVTSVSITIDGVRQQWPAGTGELQSEPLTRYDFPSLVLSSQPAFPSVPSRNRRCRRAQRSGQQQGAEAASRDAHGHRGDRQQHDDVTDAGQREDASVGGSHQGDAVVQRRQLGQPRPRPIAAQGKEGRGEQEHRHGRRRNELEIAEPTR